MKLSGDDLGRLAPHPLPLPPPVQPQLTLVEEVALLSLGSSRLARHHVARIAAHAHPDGPRDYHAALMSLVDRGMLTHAGLVRALAVTTGAQLALREARVASIIRRPAAPGGVDAELLVLLAAARALTLRTDDHIRAHVRVSSIGQRGPIPTAVAVLADELGTAGMTELADQLLPATRHDLHDANFAGRTNLDAALTYGPGQWC